MVTRESAKKPREANFLCCLLFFLHILSLLINCGAVSTLLRWRFSAWFATTHLKSIFTLHRRRRHNVVSRRSSAYSCHIVSRRNASTVRDKEESFHQTFFLCCRCESSFEPDEWDDWSKRVDFREKSLAANSSVWRLDGVDKWGRIKKMKFIFSSPFSLYQAAILLLLFDS